MSLIFISHSQTDKERLKRDVAIRLSPDTLLYLTQKQSIQAQVASESAHELDEIQRAIAAESQSSRGSASIGNGGASVVGGAPAGVKRHFLAACRFRHSRGAGCYTNSVKTKAVQSVHTRLLESPSISLKKSGRGRRLCMWLLDFLSSMLQRIR